MQMESVSVSLSDRRVLDGDPIGVLQDFTVASLVRFDDGMSP